MTGDAGFDELSKQAKRLVSAGEYRRARDVYQRALAIQPDSWTAHHGLGKVCFLLGETEQAIDHFRKVNRIDPSRASAFINVGAVYNRDGRHKEAVDALRRGIRLDPRCAEGYYNLGIAHRRLGQLSLAVQAYREAARLDPQMADAHLNLANVYVEMGQLGEAVVHFQKALSLRPDFDRARRGLERAQRAQQVADKPARAQGAGTAVPGAPHRSGQSSRGSEPGVAFAEGIPLLAGRDKLAGRAVMHSLAEGSEQFVAQLAACVREELEPALRELELAVLQPAAGPKGRGAVVSRLRGARGRFEELRSRLRDHFDKMRQPASPSASPDRSG